MKLELKLSRIYQNKNKTLGQLKLYDGKELILKLRTVELPWLDNKPYISCVPAGRYLVAIHQSPKHGWCLWILNVPGRTEILIHIGNFVRSLHGCIAPGLYHKDIDRDGVIDTGGSGDAMKILQMYLEHSKVTHIKITNPPIYANFVEKNNYIPNYLKKLLT